MMLRMAVVAAVAVALLASAPAFAEVKSIDLAKPTFSSDEKIAFKGKATGGEQFVIQITKKDSTNPLRNSMVQAHAGPDGAFETTAQAAKKTIEGILKTREGIYNVTVTAGSGDTYQNKVTMFQIEYKDGKVTKYEPPVPKVLIAPIKVHTVGVGESAIVKLGLAEGSVQGAKFSVIKAPSGVGPDDYKLSPDNKLVWTPEKKHGSDRDVPYKFTIEAKKGNLKATQEFSIWVKKAFETPKVQPTPVVKTEPAAQPEPEPAAFAVDPEKGAQHYVDRYTNEPAYKEWFEKNYPQYSSIYEAVGLEEPKGLADFVKPDVKPQTYVDRYNTEPAYKEWFEKNYPQYSSIYEAVGLEEPMPVASFVKADVDPQTYVDRYNQNPEWKAWFHENFGQYSSIYQAVGLKEVSADPAEKPYGSCGSGTMLVDDTCTIPTEKQYGFCGAGTTLVDEECVIGTGAAEKPWWQFW